MSEIQSVKIEKPEWCVGSKINELKFCEYFLGAFPLVYCEGSFFDCKGRVPMETIRGRIFHYVSMYVKTGLPKTVNTLLEVLKLSAAGHLSVLAGGVQCSNGTYILDSGKFVQEWEPCRGRLPVRFNPEAPEPVRWKAFLGELLEEEDILTLQEFMGYCLVPTNMAQKMLLILGNGGEGKSRIGILMQKLLGDTMCNGSLNKLEHSPFSRADLQHKLVMVDDDLQLGALKTTSYIKSLITAEQPMDLERKGEQSYQGLLYCRFLAFGNGNLRSLHDRSHGFFRRQIILTTKPRPRDRVDDPWLSEALEEELEGILQWCIQGLQRLREQDLHFTLSRRSRMNLLWSMQEGNSAMEFMRSTGYIRTDPEGKITSRHLYGLYREWCDDNIVPAMGSASFVTWLNQNAHLYGIRYSTHIPGGSGREVRGFVGIRGVM